ncbi:hypothetical protein [Methanolobus mangrovi]|uniref:Uncharacterized protein n=1 Tax=Methanolobus mangrovi TaxID=3072977 RepID=A0AA51UFB9_9EURY|nr:hypothetical protein [Methanolobus mangrovi]WMW21909.1 hypothetical protein RE476_11110 [Methanolobus mangrovi]
MKEQDEQKFDEFREMFSRYLDTDDLSEQEFELRCNMINFVKSACIQTLISY